MVDLGARRRLVGDDGVVDSVATWAWMLLSLWRRAFYFSLSSISNLGAKAASSSVRWMWLSSTPGGSWSVTLTSLTVPNSRRGQHSPCGGGRSLSPWATPLPTVAAGVVELLFLFALACQSSCILTRISQFRLWASFLRTADST